jgi:iron complex transport system permease protein
VITPRPALVLAAIAMATVAAAVLSLTTGAESISFVRAMNAGTHDATILWQLRVPRTALGLIAGAVLGVSGMVFQATFRNPLATPYTLGVSSGAAFGASLAITMGFSTAVAGLVPTTIGAFLGAVVSLSLVYTIAYARGDLSPGVFLLAGVAISLFFASLLLFIQYMSGFIESFRLMRWMMGGLRTTGARDIVTLLIPATAGLITVGVYRRELNMLTTGDDLALSRGVAADRVRIILFAATTLMVAAVVATCGPIGFVGLMAPHICRLLVGPDHRWLMPATLLFGGGFLVLCDAIGQLVVRQQELAVGVITALCGGPFFIYLLLGARRGVWGREG